ncbi:MAG: GNAT family N-acetyltransferase [Chloroflexi bacterium HGW-Chloroflexi-4]|jgi:ribosomal protein S18 acetylase RimI-like enzyme|nr:MAG: GNAT family N-acetyltransferase [Chloroflexi bacterium HGW-Chloroflexi-4]
MKLLMRKYQETPDYQRIRDFLQETYLLNDRREVNWNLNRWEYWQWHVNENVFHFNLSAAVFIWENEDGKIVAVLNPEGSGEAFLQIHPDYKTRELEIEMISIAETQFASTQPDGTQELTIWANEYDYERQDLFSRRGYVKQASSEYQRHRDMSHPIPEMRLPEGYTMKTVDAEKDLPARSWVSWKAFHADEPDEKYEGWDWYKNVQRAPLYRSELDLVAIAPNGDYAAFVTIWYDEGTQTATLDPVGTHPDHQRKGLSKALIAEGLRRVKKLGATLCTVGSFSERAGALYASMGFTKYELSEPWMKKW